MTGRNSEVSDSLMHETRTSRDNDNRESLLNNVGETEQDYVNNLDLMTKKIRNMVSQEVAKAQQASLPHLYDNISAFNYRDFSACNPPYYTREQNPFKCYRWLQDMEEVYSTCGCPENLRVTLIGNQLREKAKEWWGFLKQSKGEDVIKNLSWDEFKKIFIYKFSSDAEGRFCPEYVRNEKMLIEPSLEHEQETKKGVNRTSLKRKVDQSGPSAKRQRFGGDFNSGSQRRIQRMDNLQCTQCGKYHPDRRGPLPTPRPLGAAGHLTILRPNGPPSHVYQMMTTEEAKEAHDVVTCTFFVNLLPARVLFDSGSDRSFVSESFSRNFIISTSKLNPSLDVEVAGNKIIHVVSVFQNYEIEIDNEKFLVDLIPMPMGEINVVIGMDWLSKNKAIISCQNKLIRVKTPSGGEMFIYGERRKTSLAICMYAKANKHLASGCQAYLAHVVDIQKNNPENNSIPIVREFSDVFPKEISGIPPDRQVEFRIDLTLGSTPVAKTPYRLAPSEMQELMKQL
ncbi:reverse transcriptase domain-containing protein [Tanacetum coccineum]